MMCCTSQNKWQVLQSLRFSSVCFGRRRHACKRVNWRCVMDLCNSQTTAIVTMTDLDERKRNDRKQCSPWESFRVQHWSRFSFLRIFKLLAVLIVLKANKFFFIKNLSVNIAGHIDRTTHTQNMSSTMTYFPLSSSDLISRRKRKIHIFHANNSIFYWTIPMISRFVFFLPSHFIACHTV